MFFFFRRREAREREREKTMEEKIESRSSGLTAPKRRPGPSPSLSLFFTLPARPSLSLSLSLRCHASTRTHARTHSPRPPLHAGPVSGVVMGGRVWAESRRARERARPRFSLASRRFALPLSIGASVPAARPPPQLAHSAPAPTQWRANEVTSHTMSSLPFFRPPAARPPAPGQPLSCSPPAARSFHLPAASSSPPALPRLLTASGCGSSLRAWAWCPAWGTRWTSFTTTCWR